MRPARLWLGGMLAACASSGASVPLQVAIDFSRAVGPRTSAIPTYLDDVNPGTMGPTAALHDAVFDKVHDLNADMVRYNHWDPFSLSYPEPRPPVIVPSSNASGIPTMRLLLTDAYPAGVFNDDAHNVTTESGCKELCLQEGNCVGATWVARPLSPCNLYTSFDPKTTHPLKGCSFFQKMGNAQKNQTFWNFTEADPYVISFMEASKGHDSLISWTPLPPWLAALHARADFGTLLGQYFSRIISWYTKGGMHDEIGVFHASGHNYSWRTKKKRLSGRWAGDRAFRRAPRHWLGGRPAPPANPLRHRAVSPLLAGLAAAWPPAGHLTGRLLAA